MKQFRNLVVVGASAGGVEALRSLAAALPPDLPAAVLIVLHLPAGGTSALPKILGRAGPLKAVSARTGMWPMPGTIYAAPPDHHLLVTEEGIILSHGPTENGHRPAINALFRSAALTAGIRTIGVMLSGTLDDGVAGLRAIGSAGGLKLVQDPEDCLYPGMPENARRFASPDHVGSATTLAKLIGELAREPVDDVGIRSASRTDELEHRIARYGGTEKMPGEYNPSPLGTQSGFSCPDCQGTLAETEPGSSRYRCRIGHAWTGQALLEAQGGSLERALWTALRSLDEKVNLATRMSTDAGDRGHERLKTRYALVAEESRAAADVLRQHLVALSPSQHVDAEGFP